MEIHVYLKLFILHEVYIFIRQKQVKNQMVTSKK